MENTKTISMLVVNETPMLSSEELSKGCNKKHKNLIKAIDIYLCSLPGAKTHIKKTKDLGVDGEGYVFDVQGFTAIAPYLSSNQQWILEIAEAFEEASKQLSKEREKRATEGLRQATQRLREERDEAKEKAETLDALCNSSDYYSFSDAAKLIGVKRKTLIQALEEHEYIIRRTRRGRYNQTTLIPQAQYLVGSGEGLFVLKQIKYGPTWKNEKGEICQSASMWPYLTEKGIVKVRMLLKRWGQLAA